jgi:hypothetical protein
MLGKSSSVKNVIGTVNMIGTVNVIGTVIGHHLC